MLMNFTKEGEDCAPQDHFSFFDCESGCYDASSLSVSASEDGVHVCATDWAGRETSVVLSSSDTQELLSKKESLIHVADDGSLWVSVMLPEGPGEDGGFGPEILLSERIDDFFACLESTMELSLDIRDSVLLSC